MCEHLMHRETQQAGLVREVCGPGGKDAIVFASRAWLQQPAKVSLPEPPPAAGLLLPGGDINWSCPCLGGMAAGPCGPQFRDAFSCFHYRYLPTYFTIDSCYRVH